MSTTIDERVVSMQFDNRHFEANVKTSLSTLDKLKQSLNFTGSSKGLDNVNNAVKNVNMNPLSNGIETVKMKFSAMEVMAVTALSNITNSAVNAGKNIVKSLTIDPIKSGFSEYETKMGSIQTILANTEHQGTTLDQVTSALEVLNLYADKTIYNFQEMTRNIGTFTAAGIDLDTSVKSIQGIANLAAVSGSTSQQASTAMYQLSQALAAGTVKLMDWNSVVNAGMGGKVFQNALIQTAAMLDGSADKVEEWQKKHIDAHGSFRESLSKEQWLTSEVLTKTLEQFTMAAEEGSKEWEAFKKSLMSDGYTEEQATSILKMANTATDAATKVKTFTQLMDTLKESAQSGWAQTWEAIVGDFEEAKEFFTGLSDLFGGIIGDSAERRNALITETMSSNWDKLTAKINEAGIETSIFEDKIRSIVGDDKIDELISKYGSLPKVFQEGALSTDILKKALGELGNVGKTAFDFSDIAEKVKGNNFLYSLGDLGKVNDEVKRIQEALNSLGYDISADGKFGKATYDAVMAFQKAQGIKIDGIVGEETIAALDKATGKTAELTDNTDELVGTYDELIENITKKSGRELLLGSLLNIIKAIHRPLAAVGEALRNTFSVSPTQLYNALESINKFTDKFVMKGVLDVSTWDELIDKVEGLGISSSKFRKRLTEVLKSHGTDIDDLFAKYKDWKGIFEAGIISPDILKETLLGFDGVTESMLLGGESADKVRRAFEGLFAILDIIGTVAGGGFKIVFKILTAIMDAFGTSVLDVAANLGDAISGFRDWLFEGNLIAKAVDKLIEKLPIVVANLKEWFSVFKETPAVSRLVTAIENIGKAFDKLISGDMDISEFARSLGTNLAEAVKSLPGIAMQIASDFVSGFINGLGFSISGIIDNVVEFCLEFVSAFSEALGVQSPSWKAYDIAVDFIQGFVNGIKTIFATVKKVLYNVGEFVVKIFKDIWDSITDESGNIQWGKIVAGGIIFSVLWILKQFATAFSGIAGAFGGLDDIFQNTANAIKSFKKVLDGYAWDLKAAALQKVAIAIAILVGSIWVLTAIDDIGKLWNAVGVIAALAAIVVGLAFAMGALSKASITYEKGKFDAKGLQTSLLQIGLVIALLAGAVYLIGSMKPEQAKQGFKALAGIALALIAFMAAMGGISRYSKDTDKLGSMLIKISVAMLLLVGVVKLIGGLSAEAMLKGFTFMLAFALFTRAVVSVAKSSGNNVSKVGGMLIKLTIAMGLMVGVVKLASLLSPKEMFKGAAFAAGFVIFVEALVKCTKIGKNQHIAKLGGLLLSVSFSLVMMIGVCKLVNKLTLKEIIKGAAFATGFALFMKAFVKILTVGNDKQIAKVASTILAFSIAIGVLAGVSVLLSLVDNASLVKGIVAVGMLSLMMTLMAKSLKGAQNAKGAIMMMAVCIGVMTAAVVGLSFIPVEKLAPAVLALSVLMGAFALMLKSLSGLKLTNKQLGPIIAMVGAVAVFAGIIVLLKNIDPISAIGSVIALSTLMLAMSLVLTIISKITTKLGDSLKGVLGLTLMAIPLLALVGVLRLMNNVQNAITNTMALIALATALTALLIPLTIIGFIATSGVGAAAVGLGIAALLLMAIPLLALVGVLALMNNVQNAITNTMALIALATALTALLIPLTIIGFIAVTGIGAAAVGLGIAALLLMVVPLLALVGVLALMNKVENATANSILLITLLTVMTDVLIKLSIVAPLALMGVAAVTGLILLIGAIGGLAVAIGLLMDTFPSIQKFLDTGLPVLEQLAGSIGTMIGKFISGIGEGLGNTLVTLGEDLASFMSSLATASDNASGIKGEAFDGVGKLMAVLAGIGATSVGSTITDMFTGLFGGETSMEKFENDAIAFFKAMGKISDASAGISANEESIGTVISIAGKLVTLQSSLGSIGGVVSWFTGRDDLGTFGANISEFISSMKTGLAQLNGFSFNADGLSAMINAATDLSGLQTNLENIGGVVDWFTGRDDLGTFGVSVGEFITSMKTALSQLNGFSFNSDGLNLMINAATDLSGLQDSLASIGGVVDWFTGRDDLGTFGVSVGEFITSMKTALSQLNGFSFNSDALAAMINAATDLSGLQESLASIGGVVDWFTGRDDLGTFGTSVSEFITSMKTALATLDGATLDKEALSSVVAAASELAVLQTSLTSVGGVVDWFTGRDDLGTFGDNLGLFASGMAALKTGMGESGISEDVVTSVSNAGKAIIALQEALPKEGLFDGKMNLSDFATYVTDFGTAMGSFSANISSIDPDKLGSAISIAYRIKGFIETLVGLDISGVSGFAGTGGALVSIGQGLGLYSSEIAAINIVAISTSVDIAVKLRNLISSLVNLNTSGISNFNAYAIATALSGYYNTISAIDFSTISSSITATTRLASLINSLVGIDTSGISTFQTAILDLARTDVDSLINAFSGKAESAATSINTLINAVSAALSNGATTIDTAMTNLVNVALKAVNNKKDSFTTAGEGLVSSLVTGLGDESGSVSSAGGALGSSVNSGIREKYTLVQGAGNYLALGLIRGLNGARESVKSAARNLADAVKEGITLTLIIRSPSRLAEQYGAYTGQGFVNGLNAYTDRAYDAGTELGNGAATGLSDTISKISDAVSGDMDMSPTIRPVVDLSDVNAGADVISSMFNGKYALGANPHLGTISTLMNGGKRNANDDVISAIRELNDNIAGMGNTYTINGITYDDGSGVAEAIRTITRAAKLERRV